MLQEQLELRSDMEKLRGETKSWSAKKIISQIIVELTRRDVPQDKLVELRKLYDRIKAKSAEVKA